MDLFAYIQIGELDSYVVKHYGACSFTDDSCNGEPECPKRKHCQFYSYMPDVKSLLALADEMDERERGE